MAGEGSDWKRDTCAPGVAGALSIDRAGHIGRSAARAAGAHARVISSMRAPLRQLVSVRLRRDAPRDARPSDKRRRSRDAPIRAVRGEAAALSSGSGTRSAKGPEKQAPLTQARAR